MTRKTQNQGNKTKNGTEASPEELMTQFTQLWQEKWGQMLREKGWPTDMPPPNLAAMPFLNPFMMPMMNQGGMNMNMGMGNTSHDIILAKLNAIETRLAKLESLSNNKTKAPAKKTKAKAKSSTSVKKKTAK